MPLGKCNKVLLCKFLNPVKPVDCVVPLCSGDKGLHKHVGASGVALQLP